jgi:hypothetical protein
MSDIPEFLITGVQGLPLEDRRHLMVLLERRYPDLLWDSGDTPTGWLEFGDTYAVGVLRHVHYHTRGECRVLYCHRATDAKDRKDICIGYREALRVLGSPWAESYNDG